MPSKLKHSKPKRKHPYIAPKPKKPKIWGQVAPGLAILRYRPEIKELKGSMISRKIKNTSACIVAPVFVAVEEFRDWSTHLVENIFEIGNEVHRLTLHQLKLRANSSYPIQCVCPTFFLNYHKVTVLVKPCAISNPLQGGISSNLGEDQIQSINQLLSENHGVVVQCPGKTYALWKDKGKIFALIPDGFQGVDSNIPVLLKSMELKNMLEHSLQFEHGICSIYSVKVLSKSKVSMTLDNINDEFDVADTRDSIGLLDATPEEEEQVPEAPPAPVDIVVKTKKDKKKEKKLPEPEPVEAGPTEDMILAYSSDYKEFPDNRGILTGKEYCKDPDRILHTNIAAAVFLHHFPANLWTSAIIRDIMKLSKDMYNESENENLLEQEDWIDRIKLPIKFIRKHYLLSFEKVVFGKVRSVDEEILTVERGLMKFFESNDTGLLIGPQMVLVWQQKNNYFMFDAKERDGMGRKWTRKFSAELGSTALSGSACITWYRNPKQLADVYIENIELKHRKDPYRIVKVRVFESLPKMEDVGEWAGMPFNRWVLVGTKTLCDYSHADDTLRFEKAMCTAVSAIMHAIEKPEVDWDTETIDNILLQGIEILKQSLSAHDPANQFKLQNIKKILDIGGNRVRFNVTDCMIAGIMVGENKAKKLLSLKGGLTQFFDNTRHGVFTVKDVTLAVWRGEDNHYYLFYPYEKHFGVTPQCLCANDTNMPPMGIANALRFKTVEDLMSFLSCCLNTKDTDQFCLSPTDISLSDSTDRPPLQEYEEFGVGGAIIRPFKDLHEGHEIYGVRADKQTIANLLTALGFNRINSSLNWNKEDLADILNIGDKIFCKIFMGLPECQARDYKLQWEDVVPVVGMNKFTFTRDPKVGVIEIAPELLDEEVEREPSNHEDTEDEGVEVQDDELFVRPQEGELPTIAGAKDLRGLLQTWDQSPSQHHEAVLETDFYKIAIWKRDNRYFVFDPKASGENGELTERRIEIGKDNASGDSYSVTDLNSPYDDNLDTQRKLYGDVPLYLEKRNYSEFENEGSAYTAWFTDFDEFFNHISAKTPEEHKYGKCTLHDLVLTNTPVGTADFEFQLKPGYRAVAPNHSIVRGSMKQNNPSLVNRNKQEYSNCMVAIAFAMITPSNKMTTTLLDVVLKYGDRLYTKSLNALKNTNRAKFWQLEKLSLDEISPLFSIYKINFSWQLSSTLTGNLNINELRKAIGKIGSIETGNAVIFRHKGFVMAFWKSEGNFYLYDPFETNPSGLLAENGLPSLSQFSKLENLCSLLLAKFACLREPNTFELYIISIKSTPVTEVNFTSMDAEENPDRILLLSRIPKGQQMFQLYQNDMRILKAPLSMEKMPPHSLALAALVHSRLQFVELWSYNISQRILFLSRCLLRNSGCEMNNPMASISFDNILCRFAIDNDILCHIRFTKNIQGPIYSLKRTEIVGINLKNALKIFFKNCQHAIISMPGFNRAFSLWKECGKFYLFGVDRNSGEIFVIASPNLTNLFDNLFKGINADDDNSNWYELRSVTVTTVPIKESSCKPKAKVTEGPFATKGGDYMSDYSKESHFYDYVSEKPENLLAKPQVKEFLEMANGIEVLYSKETHRTHRFIGSKDFFPSLLAACVETCALSRVKSPTMWTKRTLDQIIVAGINLYINTVAVKGTSELQIVDFKGDLYIGNSKLEVCPLAPKVQTGGKEDLLMCLSWILRNYQTAYLYTENFCFALISENKNCFLYYPGSSEVLCENMRPDCSCLMRFCTVSDLLDVVLANGEIALCENICIGPIRITKE